MISNETAKFAANSARMDSVSHSIVRYNTFTCTGWQDRKHVCQHYAKRSCQGFRLEELEVDSITPGPYRVCYQEHGDACLDCEQFAPELREK